MGQAGPIQISTGQAEKMPHMRDCLAIDGACKELRVEGGGRCNGLPL